MKPLEPCERSRRCRPLARLAGAALVVALTACRAPDPESGDSVDAANTSGFVDITTSSGLVFTHRHGGSGRRYLPETMGSGGAVLDADNDGLMDLLLLQGSPLPGHPDAETVDFDDPDWAHQLYLNRGDGRFVAADGAIPALPGSYAMGSCAGDINNDGHTDLYIAAFGEDVLLVNDGGGRFVPAGAESGIANPDWGASCAIADYDRDGCLDIVVTNYLDAAIDNHVRCGPTGDSQYCHPDVYSGVPDRLFRNRCDGSGGFEDVSESSGVAIRDPNEAKGLGVIFADLDGDGWQDIYVANDSTRNFLFINQRNGRFEETGVLSGAAYNADGKTEAGMGIATGDFSDSGRPDLVVTHLDFETNTFYRNLGGGQFEDATLISGLAGPSMTRVGFGIVSLDADNDSDLDLYVANGHILDNINRFNSSLTHAQADQLLINQGDGRFVLLQPEQAGDWFARSSVSRGAAAVDIDNDGRMDLLVTNNNAPAVLLGNALASDQTWVGIDLRSRYAGRPAIGAQARLQLASGRILIRDLMAGSSYLVSEDPRLHFAIPAGDRIDHLEIRWPEGQRTRTEADHLKMGQWQRIDQPDAE